MTICIIGIDCATDPKKIGLARGYVSNGVLIVDKLGKVTAGQTVSDVVRQWIEKKWGQITGYSNISKICVLTPIYAVRGTGELRVYLD